MGYDRGDINSFDFESNRILFSSKLKGILSPRSYPIQFERKWESSFLSVEWDRLNVPRRQTFRQCSRSADRRRIFISRETNPGCHSRKVISNAPNLHKWPPDIGSRCSHINIGYCEQTLITLITEINNGYCEQTSHWLTPDVGSDTHINNGYLVNSKVIPDFDFQE